MNLKHDIKVQVSRPHGRALPCVRDRRRDDRLARHCQSIPLRDIPAGAKGRAPQPCSSRRKTADADLRGCTLECRAWPEHPERPCTDGGRCPVGRPAGWTVRGPSRVCTQEASTPRTPSERPGAVAGLCGPVRAAGFAENGLRVRWHTAPFPDWQEPLPARLYRGRRIGHPGAQQPRNSGTALPASGARRRAVRRIKRAPGCCAVWILRRAAAADTTHLQAKPGLVQKSMTIGS